VHAAKSDTGALFLRYAARRALALAAVVVITPSLTFVVFNALDARVPLWVQARRLPGYLSDTFLHLDFGQTGPVTQPEEISHLVLSGLPVDAALLAGGLLLGIAVGLVTGTVCGARRDGRTDRALLLGTSLGVSVPVYFLAAIALVLFAPDSGRWPVPFFSDTAAYVAPLRDPLGWVQAMWVPCAVLAVPVAAMCHRMVRATLHDVLDEDLLRTARAKGLRERAVMTRHALPLTLPPVLGLISGNMALLVTNAALIEHPFNLPGAFRFIDIGQFRGEYAHSPQPEIVQALVVEAAVLIALFVLVCDVLQARLDPRVAAAG
jgi:peptide/nickel transport system permease protein